MDIGKDGDIPRNRRVWYKTGMSSTTLDLFDGTTKATYQVRKKNANVSVIELQKLDDYSS